MTDNQKRELFMLFGQGKSIASLADRFQVRKGVAEQVLREGIAQMCQAAIDAAPKLET